MPARSFSKQKNMTAIYTNSANNSITKKLIEDRENYPITFFEKATIDNGEPAAWITDLKTVLTQYLPKDQKLKAISTKALEKLSIAGKDKKFKDWRAANMPVFVSGNVPRRGEPTAYPNLQVFDIDNLELPFSFFEQDIENVPFVLAAFPSQSGKGFRIWVWTNASSETHKDYYAAICKELSKLLNIPLKAEITGTDLPHIDDSTKDINRIWFANHVPEDEIYINWESQTFCLPEVQKSSTTKQKRQPERQQGGGYAYDITIEDEFQDMVRQIVDKRLDLTPGKTANWFKIGVSIANKFGEAGREDFHQVSQFHPGYNRKDTDKQYNECLAKDKGKIKIDTFFKMYGDAGITVDRERIYQNWKSAQSQPAPQPVKEDPEPEEGKEEDFSNKQAKELETALKAKWDFRFNAITRMPEFRIKGKGEFKRMDDYSLNSITRKLRLSGIAGANKTRIAETIESGFSPLVDPIEAFFKELKPDDKDHIKALCETVSPLEGQTEMFEKYLKKWFVGAVANVFTKDRCANHLCFIITGQQGAFKSTWIRHLCPPELINYYFEGNLDPENKDDLFATTANFIYNLDDYFAEVTKKKINSLKSFITKDTVNARRAYGRYPEELPKICSFIASSNDDTFLHDPTGNRRFIPFEVTAIDIEAAKKIDINQVWGQAYQLFRKGFTYWLDREDQQELKEHNSKYEVQSLEFELVNTYFQLPKSRNEATAYLTTADIINWLAQKSSIRMTPKKIGEAMKKAGFDRFQKRLEGKTNPSWVYAIDHTEDIDIHEEKTTGGGLPS